MASTGEVLNLTASVTTVTIAVTGSFRVMGYGAFSGGSIVMNFRDPANTLVPEPGATFTGAWSQRYDAAPNAVNELEFVLTTPSGVDVKVWVQGSVHA